jgi:hypothetical protein
MHYKSQNDLYFRTDGVLGNSKVIWVWHSAGHIFPFDY